ncbi:MAG TPA: SAM-dependent DNA methyltransferase, partial [Candidatus Wallbacteria bacterium]|nr:SAM-dependent DNA methyltransferase [Candidatus Wallbacteria bacterium]
MQPLEKSLRNKLESTIKEARDIAELAAAAALEQLGVGAAVQFKHLNDTEKELRRKLRIHGRQLGDVLKADQTQTLSLLIEEVAYEHWHRMLFAKFLAENNLLMYPDPVEPVPVSLSECEDLAVDEGARNGWELASRFAAKMLPQIFRPDSPVFQLILPPEHQLKLEKLLNDLPSEVFKASDSLGWVYQFWQAKRKEDVNASEVKIGAHELPAVTQLFTEPYMVAFLLDNSLGAWWVSKIAGLRDGKELRPGACNILKTAGTEEELRKFFALPGVPLEYLRFIKTESGSWSTAAGIFEKWPNNLSELKTLDPSCGSGHFLVAALLMLVSMQMELEKLTAREAVDLVLRDNIHGLELDRRCVELAAFALAFTAWKYPEAGGYRILPELNVACSGLAVSLTKDEWKQLAFDKHNYKSAMAMIYDVFQNAPVLGSL